MKIGIITYQRAHNYGALLQAFALKTWVELQGCQVEIIDYWPEYHSGEYKLLYHFKARSFLGKLKAIAYLLLGLRKILQRKNGYEKFIRNSLGLPRKPRYFNGNDFSNLSYDVIIYGSDQIWRKVDCPRFKGFDDLYWGSNINCRKKISFAASMGIIALDQKNDQEFLRRQLNQFARISVREKDLQNKVLKITGIKPDLVLDPVFLLGEEVWMTYVQIPKSSGKYILFYQLTKSDEAVQLANMLKARLGFPVVEILGRVNPLKVGKRYYQTASPFDFVSLIYNAEFIVSTSFHGAAFSVIFRKQFYAIGMGNNNGRALTLLENLGIKERYLKNVNDANINDRIDYSTVVPRLKNCINNSLAYLRSAIDG